MIIKIKKIWNYCNENLFFVFIMACILFLLCYGLYLKIKGYEGSWSKDYFYPFDRDTNIRRKKYDNYNNYYDVYKIKEPRGDSKGELECRRVLEKIFRKSFNKARPNFLNNPVTGGNFNLELDCYNDELNIACEYHGAQHYKYIPYFHKNKESFYNQRYRDELKRRMCKDNGIILIEVPHTVKVENIENYIYKELKKYNI
jgi:hypothetical protein